MVKKGHRTRGPDPDAAVTPEQRYANSIRQLSKLAGKPSKSARATVTPSRAEADRPRLPLAADVGTQTPASFLEPTDEEEQPSHGAPLEVIRAQLSEWKAKAILWAAALLVPLLVGLVFTVWQIVDGRTDALKDDFRESIKDLRDDLRRDLDRIGAAAQAHEDRIRRLETRKGNP
jgi:hypothetical protein